MADVVVRCRKCGKENKVSEYATASSATCAGCRTLLELPENGKESKLQIRRLGVKKEETLTGKKEVVDQAVQATAAQRNVAVLGEVHRVRQKATAPKAFWMILAFLVVGGALFGALYIARQNPELGRHYALVRNVVGGIVWLIVLIVAFEDSTLQGLLSLLVPFYVVYYVVVRMESYWIRGAFFAVCAVLGAELYYLPQDALLVAAQHQLNVFIDSVGHLIQRGGDPLEKMR